MTSPLDDRPSRQVEIGGAKLDVRVRESPRAKTTRLLVGVERPLEIIVPAGTSDSEIDAALGSRRKWIAEKLERVRAVQARMPELGLDRSATVWLAGEPVPVVRDSRPQAQARLTQGRLLLSGDGAAAEQAVIRWYRREAKRAARASVDRHAQGLRVAVAHVAIREQRTRWGSCSARGNVSLNWRLVMAPSSVLEYVAVHELCHLRVPNHSKRFWRLLEAALPGWQSAARWLQEHGQEIRAYRPVV